MVNHPPALRPATNADAPAVQSLIFSVLQEYGLQPDPASTDSDLFDLEGSYRDKGGYFGVVESETGDVPGTTGIRPIIATVGLLPLGDKTCELRKMYALPSARGRGLGRYLLDFSLTTARSWGCQRMVLETASVLTEAVALYQRYGFTPYTPPDITCRCDMAMELIL